jgi:hypothetical protein
MCGGGLQPVAKSLGVVLEPHPLLSGEVVNRDPSKPVVDEEAGGKRLKVELLCALSSLLMSPPCSARPSCSAVSRNAAQELDERPNRPR